MAARNGIKLYLLAMLVGAAGCRSRQELTNAAAIEQAKLMAAQTNSPIKVVTVDAAGTTMLTIVRPPAPGTKTQQLATQTLPQAASTSAAARLPVLPIITPADEPEAPAHPQ